MTAVMHEMTVERGADSLTCSPTRQTRMPLRHSYCGFYIHPEVIRSLALEQ